MKSHLAVPLGSASLSKEEGTPHLVIAVPVMIVEETVRTVARSHYRSWWYASSFSTSRGSAAKGAPRRFAVLSSLRSSEVWLPIDVAAFGVSQTSNRMYRACVPTCITTCTLLCVLEAEPPAKTCTGKKLARDAKSRRGCLGCFGKSSNNPAGAQAPHALGRDSWFVFRSQMHANSTGIPGFLVVDIHLLPAGLVIR